MSVTTQRKAGHANAVPSKRPRWPLIVLGLVTVGMVVYLLSAYVPPDMGTSRIPPRSTLHYVLLVTHIFTAAVAALAGIMQFWPWLRSRHPAVHRWSGRAYFFLGVFPSSIVAIPVAVLGPFGSANQAALVMLDVLWIITGVAGYRAIRQRRYADHRRWMIRNYALTFGAIASRFWIPVMVLATVPQATSVAYGGDTAAIGHDIASGSAWLGLAVNLLIAEYYIQRRYGVPAPVRPTDSNRRAS
jgi:hypothetical protein